MLVALALTVYLVVSQLSRIAASGLDDAIDADSGVMGSYSIDTRTTFGLPQEVFLQRALASLSGLSQKPIPYVIGYEGIRPECPPYDQLGTTTVRFVFNSDGTAYPLPFGEALPVKTKVCLAGSAVPGRAVYGPRETARNRWGDGLAIAPEYQSLAALMSAEPRTYRFIVTTGERNSTPELRTALSTAFAEDGVRFGAPNVSNDFLITRLDTSDQIRAASQGVKTIFAVIGWGVLGLGALGLLVSQLIVVRDRMWLFGLAMALGARRTHIAFLVWAEVALTVALGLLGAVGIAYLTQPLANAIAQSAFGTNAGLLSTGALPGLGLGCMATLMIASAWPAYRASSQDPLDVLEPKVG
ncbi:FtsX-like permease family protein [Nocardioides limicola]|uniref:FtsX-like permease family protein n=1 Tax=Nocardioides limicola TaxID=2803368 RepID=UPI00193BFB02|nr:FtsX-like permease family protein [Nocardioides sp. DJM-14]